MENQCALPGLFWGKRNMKEKEQRASKIQKMTAVKENADLVEALGCFAVCFNGTKILSANSLEEILSSP